MKKLYFFTVLFALALNSSAQTLWTGPSITFTKADGADWNLEANQDRITSNVWLTRLNNQSIFNIAVETSQTGPYDSTLSPADTEWAIGSISDGINNLTFDRFVGTLQDNVGDYILLSPMVLHLITEDIYIDVNFLSWASGDNGGQGGFSYTRSTNPAASTDDFVLDNEITLFPNPCTNYIQVGGLSEKENYTIYNILAEEVQSGEANNKEKINVNTLKEGVYFIKLENSKILKFVKE
ncbi:MAG: T9SS type A sorting domain-containing protein [Lishizhenia sp.]